MEQVLHVIMYVLTGAGIITVFSFWISDIRLDGKRFCWYCYLPAALVLALLGSLAPHIFVWWLSASSESGYVSLLIPLLYLLVIILCLAAGLLPFRKKEDFSKSFYFSLSLFSLVIIPYWIIRLVY